MSIWSMFAAIHRYNTPKPENILLPALCHAGNRIHKISSALSKISGDGGGGEATPPLPFIL